MLIFGIQYIAGQAYMNKWPSQQIPSNYEISAGFSRISFVVRCNIVTFFLFFFFPFFFFASSEFSLRHSVLVPSRDPLVVPSTILDK